MGKPYSSDLRERVRKHIEAGHTRRASARRFGVSPSFAVKLYQPARATGSTAAPARQGRPPGSGTLSAFRSYLIGRVEAQPDITLRELTEAPQTEHGHRTHPSSISRLPNAAGISYKEILDGQRAWAR